MRAADDDEDGSQVSAATPGRTDAGTASTARRHLRSPSSSSSDRASAAAPDPHQPVALAMRAQEMEAVVAAAREKAFHEQAARHAAAAHARRQEHAALERAKRELEACLIAARNQAALMQACQREESGEGTQCWDQVRGAGHAGRAWDARVVRTVRLSIC